MKHTLPILLLLLSACGSRPQGLPTPPSLPAVKIPLPPISDEALIWQPGDWVYTGGSYRYDPGRYIPAEGHSSAWTFGHWAGTRDHYVWVPGSWYAPGMH